MRGSTLEQFNALVDGLPPAMIYLIVAALVFAEAAEGAPVGEPVRTLP